MWLDILSRPSPRTLFGEKSAAPAFALRPQNDNSLKLVDVSSAPVHSRSATKRQGRKSDATHGCAYVYHPDGTTRGQFGQVLRSLGLTPEDFADEPTILSRLREDRPDIILWGMPGCTSADLDRFSPITRNQPLPIVVVTTLGDELTEEQVQDAGGCDLLVLPLPCHKLAPALSLALVRYEALEILAQEYGESDTVRAARSLVWKAAKVWAKRRGAIEAEALRHILTRSQSHRHNLTRTAMEVVAEGLFP